ncbi:uncharacterized protein LOC142343097 [Convolutriloba macropyga]|uniref:uncharacterized protein LOC142343097 n=1 Tax=Convolutriloba macropyga TaxID=536237 RepID=UPI003F52385A
MDRLGWDKALSKGLQQQYSRLRVQLRELENITLPRKVVSISPASSDIELHVFCDASTTTYAAVVYIRQYFDGSVHTRMLTAKTRVAPIRSLCVPRLELCAALLGANFVEAVSSSLSDQRFPTPKVYAWTDSTVTIAWLQEFPRKWKTFVANRVAKIQNIIPSSNWNFVLTEENPADCASRRILVANLAKHSLWWNVPHWLEKSDDYWPKAESIEEHQYAVNNAKRNTQANDNACYSGEQLNSSANSSNILVWKTGQQMNWLTITPRTPHFGGLWEAAIKSMKRHFYRTVGTTKMSFESFTILITQIEAILNFRPLTAASGDSNDPSALTPAHFLIGRPLTALPEPSQEDTRTLNRRFKSINNIVRQFWKKWSVDYLTTLQHRPKWHDNKQQYAVNNIVFIKEDNTPPMLWPLARITKIFDGNDKIVRVVQRRKTHNLSYPNGRQRMTQWMRIDKSAAQRISSQQGRKNDNDDHIDDDNDHKDDDGDNDKDDDDEYDDDEDDNKVLIFLG